MTLSLARSAVLMLVLLLAFDSFVDVQPRGITRGARSRSGLLSKWYRNAGCSGDVCVSSADCSTCECQFRRCQIWTMDQGSPPS
nr:conotoxin precursor P [Conus ebraeus]UMA82895.1 conotoxin precursor P [Conus ebraeus]UMA83208.1 conotoxin precursor P [Conus judaeus]DAZ86065.1 TPA_inf: conotoxin precursor P [Conus ebraeus]DAZ86257.1 TPA_inf: conotoxin precursor P [Conus ebraeus]